MRSFSQIRARAPEFLRRVGGAALSLLYPPHCVVCGGETAAGEHVCIVCQHRARRIRAPFCQCCSEPRAGEITGLFICPDCQERDFAFRSSVAPYWAGGVVREVVHRFKYLGYFHLRHQLADWMAEGLADPRLQDPLPDALVPVPLHPARLREREFNQSAVLADLVSARSGLPVYDCLERIRYTSTQTVLERDDRMENLRGAFRLRQHTRVSCRHLLLIDDVFTTGSTVEECARTLLHGGAASVRVLVVARAVVHF